MIESDSGFTPLLALEQQRHPKLLVVDDQPSNIEALYRTFSPDHQVFMATSGERALAVCKDNPPDLVLLDVVMPDMDGYEVCARLKADSGTRDIPVIFVTSHDDADNETRGLDAGAVDFIAKPFNPRVARARVKTHLALKFQSDLLRQWVFVDGLTGVFNRRHFDSRLEAEYRISARNGSPLCVLMIDIDHFKRYNDHYGHQGGDDCLRQVAEGLQACLRRPGDLLARFGGEEFACLLPETDFAGAMALAQTMERQVRNLQIAHAGSAVGSVVTISLGVAEKPPGRLGDPISLVRQADAQLYRAKHSGRGRACGEPQVRDEAA
ncbi:MAG: PleD family two-component system response regulator [Burkholderiaceae bacterium]|nr:PleD family two-component system response regulator [Burkholderiaceae bacterium]